jgi:RNA polymerase sigma-70 factor, ECF subfamily
MANFNTKKLQRFTNTPVPFRFKGDDVALTAALKMGHPGAMEALFDRYSPHVERILVRLMQFDQELYDLLQDVFVEAYASVGALKDGVALKAWITSLAVHTARQRIRKRRRRRVYWASKTEAPPDIPIQDVGPSERELLRLVYALLEEMPTDDRIVFSLRFIDGMGIAEVASVCRRSPSTVKRRQKRAEKRFLAMARRIPILVELIERGDRWRLK